MHTHFSRSVLATLSSSDRPAAGHRAAATASSAYICSFFFSICSYTGFRVNG